MKARTAIIRAFLERDYEGVARVIAKVDRYKNMVERAHDPPRQIRQMAYEARSTAGKLYQISTGCPEWTQKETLYRRNRLSDVTRFMFWTPFRFGGRRGLQRPVHFACRGEDQSDRALCGDSRARAWGAQPPVITCRLCRRALQRRGCKLDRYLTTQQIAAIAGG